MFLSRKSLVLSAIGIIATSQVALSKTPIEPLEIGRVAVSYGDLDLGNATDAHLMLDRLQDAAYKACGGDPRWSPSYTLHWNWLATEFQQCRHDAVSRAVATVDAPLLSQVFRGDKDQRLVREAASARGKYSRLLK